MDLPLEKINDEVFVATADVVRLDASAIDFLRAHAARNARGRARICAHKSSADPLHEMLIAITDASYIRPHRHHAKSESFHLVDGEADVVVLGEDGEIEDLVELRPGRSFYYRLDTPRFHTLIVHTPVLVIHEITNGPFDRAGSEAAPFAPEEGDPAAARYAEELKVRARRWKEAHGLR